MVVLISLFPGVLFLTYWSSTVTASVNYILIVNSIWLSIYKVIESFLTHIFILRLSDLLTALKQRKKKRQKTGEGTGKGQNISEHLISTCRNTK